jgi:hypothetical protein
MIQRQLIQLVNLKERIYARKIDQHSLSTTVQGANFVIGNGVTASRGIAKNKKLSTSFIWAKGKENTYTQLTTVMHL